MREGAPEKMPVMGEKDRLFQAVKQLRTGASRRLRPR
jgi:hypothetical protein